MDKYLNENDVGIKILTADSWSDFKGIIKKPEDQNM